MRTFRVPSPSEASQCIEPRETSPRSHSTPVSSLAYSRLSERRHSQSEEASSPLQKRMSVVEKKPIHSPEMKLGPLLPANVSLPSIEEIFRIRSEEKPLGRGAAKTVYDLDENYVLVFANPGKEQELREEVDTAERIRHGLPETEQEHYIAHELYATEVPDVYIARKCGKDLQKLIDSGLTPRDAFRLIGQTFRGGASLHASGHAHGDLKPDNVFTDQGEVPSARLSDFGKTEHVGSEVTASGGLMLGNPRYSAPEQRVSKQGDSYSFGLIAIRTLDSAVGRSNEENITQQFLTIATPKTLGDRIFNVGKIAIARGASLLGFTAFKQQSKIHEYIEAQFADWVILFQRQGSNPETARFQAHQLIGLLKEMTSDNPAERPTMEDAVRQYEQIMEGHAALDPQLGE